MEHSNFTLKSARAIKALTPFEIKVINLCLAVLSDDSKSVLIQQLSQYNLVQREVDWRALNFYKVSLFQKSMPMAPLFGDKRPDYPLLKIEIVLPDDDRMNAVFHVVGGRFFCITFSKSTETIKDVTDIAINKR